MFGERARIIFDRVTIFYLACFVGVFAMSSEIVTGRGVGSCFGAPCVMSRRIHARSWPRRSSTRLALRFGRVDLAKAGAMLETEGHEKHNGNREHEYKAEDDEGERRGGGHGRKV